MEYSIKQLSEKDAAILMALLKVFEESFEMEPFPIPNQHYLETLLQRTDFIIFVALEDEKVVGGLTAYVLPQYYSAADHIYIHDLAVQTAYQRKGIGKKLITALLDFAKDKGCKEIFVAAEKADDYAVEFYRATGAEELESVHFFYKLT
jgi:aminoglycoside 3-N-acetyltransferase I